MKATANDTLYYEEDPIVSVDVIGSHYGSIFDAHKHKLWQYGRQLVKIMTWYDNEMSYTAQLVKTAKKVAEQTK